MPKVKVFSTPSCPYCVTLKEFLKSREIDFEDIDVSKDLEAQKDMVERSGQMGVPVVDIDGEMVIGFDRERITKILKLES